MAAIQCGVGARHHALGSCKEREEVAGNDIDSDEAVTAIQRMDLYVWDGRLGVHVHTDWEWAAARKNSVRMFGMARSRRCNAHAVLRRAINARSVASNFSSRQLTSG